MPNLRPAPFLLPPLYHLLLLDWAGVEDLHQNLIGLLGSNLAKGLDRRKSKSLIQYSLSSHDQH